MARRIVLVSTKLSPKADLVAGWLIILAALAVVGGIGWALISGVGNLFHTIATLPDTFWAILETVVALYYGLALLRGRVTLAGIVLLSAVLYLLVTNGAAQTFLQTVGSR